MDELRNLFERCKYVTHMTAFKKGEIGTEVKDLAYQYLQGLGLDVVCLLMLIIPQSRYFELLLIALLNNRQMNRHW